MIRRLFDRAPRITRIAGWLAGVWLIALPALAAEDSFSPDPATMPVGTIFRWLNFALVFGGIAYLFGKVLAPTFGENAREISQSIRRASETHATAERELSEAGERLSRVDLEVQDLRRAAARESTEEAERIRGLARSESEKISLAAQGEIAAAERAGRQELRSIAARLATERAAAMVRERMTPASAAALFQSFVDKLERTAR